MTRVVAMDASTWWGGVALVELVDPWGPPTLVAEAGLLVGESYAAHLLGLLDLLLTEVSWPKSSVDCYAATRGPGSFTGLRVALGTVRGLGLASGRPCLGVGTLEAMAEARGPADRERVPLIDAGRGEVYGARYDPDGSPPAEIVPPWVGPPEWVLRGGDTAPAVFGPGVGAHLGRLRVAGVIAGLETVPVPVAAGLGRLVITRLRGGAQDGEGMAPLYLRPADAEIHRARENKCE